jgi:hypothetical protein
MAALVVRSTAPTADTPILTLRPVVPIYPPLELPIRLFCVVHVHPHFQRAWLAEHLRARNADGHLLCLCPGTKEPLALMLCRCAIRAFPFRPHVLHRLASTRSLPAPTSCCLFTAGPARASCPTTQRERGRAVSPSAPVSPSAA